jgi:3-oxoacyl-[acyl-carrier protein] reductase
VRDEGRIVVIASTTPDLAFAGTAIYAGAKAAAATYARVLAKELGPRGITVNAISPGLVDTAAMRAAGNVEERLAMAKRITPLGRVGRPEDIADVVAFVVSEEARWVTAQNLRVGGGVV